MSAAQSAPDASLPMWLGLNVTEGLGPRTIARLVEHFGSVEAVYAGSLTELESCQIPAATAQAIHDGRAAEAGARELEKARGCGAEILTLADRRYPELLREIYDPPPLLYVRGAVEALDSFGIAVVGTRHPTVYGKLMAEQLARGLAAWRLTVVSGLARGIDSQGQKACIEAGGVTVAVLGTGVESIYPREHEKLAERILECGGALVSEFAVGIYAAPQNFPIRNRVISGLSLGVLVVEGGEYSGSRITARMALEQNREVFAVPGNITSKLSWLPNTLIKQGAKLVSEVADIIEELPTAVRVRLTAPPAEKSAPDVPPASSGAREVLSVLRIEEATNVDQIADRLENKFSPAEILAWLFDLELAGKVKQLPGKNYVKSAVAGG